MRRYVEINDATFPIVKINYGSFTPTMEEFEAALTEIEKQLHHMDRFVNIVDLSNVQFLGSELRIRHGEWSRKNDKLMAEKMLGLAFVVPSLIGNMMMKGVFLIQRPSVPYTVARTIEEAETWAHSRVVEHTPKG